MDKTKWTNVAATVENSTADSGNDILDKSIATVDGGTVVKSTVGVESDHHCVHCFFRFHGGRNHFSICHDCWCLRRG